MRKKPKKRLRGRHLSKAGICFEVLEPRLLLSGSWGAIVDGPGAESQADTRGGLTQGAVVSHADSGIIGAGSVHRSLTPENGRVDLLSQAPVLNPFGNVVPALDASPASILSAPVTGDTPAMPLTDQSDAASNPEMHSDSVDAATRRELVFVNDNVDAYEILINGIRESDTNRDIEIVVLDADRDGIQQVSDILADRSDLAAVHVIAHGSDGQISIGGSWLNSTTLQQNKDTVASWGNALTGKGDILFYGCNLASSGNGHSLLNNIAHLTGADVAASDDNTGHAVFDADWDLEFTTGKIETPMNLSQELQDNWGHLLNVAVDATSTGTSTGGDFSVSHTTSGTDRLMLVGVSMNLGGSQTVSSITFNSDSLSLVGVEEAGDARIEIWALLAPDVGTFNVDIVFSSPTDGNTAGVMTFTGVDQSTPLGAFASDSGHGESTASATVSSAADELVFGVVSIDDPNFRVLTEGAGQTERWELDGFQTTGAGSTAPGAPSINMSWTWAPSDNWAAGGVSIKPSVSNTIPIVTTGAGTTPYTEQAAATVIDTGITLVDPDGYDGVDPSDQYTAVIRITGNYIAADTLGFTNTASIQGVLAGDTLTLSVIGGQTASVAEFQAALRSVTFFNGSDSPGTLDRTISFTFDDGVDSSNTAMKVVQVAAVNDHPTITSNGGGDTTNINVAENITVVTTVTASDADGDTLVYSKNGGADAALFSIDANTGVLTFNSAPNFEAPADADSNNVYEVTVLASDGKGGTDSQAISVTVTDALELVVTNTNATGTGSLHETILNANADVGVTNTITFDIPGAGPHIISLTGALPAITDTVIINGTTDPDYVDTPLIVLDGSSAGLADGITLAAGSDGSEIRGLVINGFSQNGILIHSNANTIAGNWIGVDPTGTVATGNGMDGVQINGENNIIGSAVSADRNVISGNGDEGIDINAIATGTIIQGNYVGTNADGTVAIPNGTGGIGNWGGILVGGHNTTIGGSNPGEGNLVSGNHSWGIILESNNNVVQGSLIGTAVDGTTALGNSGHGILINDFGGGLNNLIGGETPGAGNIIAFNALNGVNVESGATNAIVRNSIHSNTLIGINLGTAGVTVNDSGDGDGGANNLQNFLVLTSAETNGSQITITGSINSTPSTSFRIEFYSNTTGDASGYGEGQTLIGVYDTTTDISGNAAISAVLPAAVSAGSFVSGTVSRLDAGDAPIETSEFAQSVVATAAGNTVPVLSTSGGATNYTEQATPTIIDAGITLVDPDGYDGVDPSDQYTAVIRITGNYEAADTLNFTNTANIQGTLAGDTLTLSVIGGQTASVAEFQAALRSVTFFNGSDSPGTLDRTISFTFDDGVDSSNTAMKVVQVTAVNDKPVLLTGSVSNLMVNEDAGLTSLGLASVTYGPGGGSDESGQTLTYEVTVIPDPGVGYVFLADGTTQVTPNSYTLAQIQGMQFAPAPNATGTTGFQYNVTDSGGTANGGIDSISQFIMITVNSVNDAPTGSVTIDDTTPVEGQTLTAANTLADVDGMGAITFTWKADGTVVGTGATYTTTAGDVGRVITVEAAYTDGNGTPELVASAPTAAVSDVDQLASITGDTTYNGNEGDSAIGDLDATDADGLTDGTYFSISAQGTRGTASIDVATGAWNYVPADADWYGSDSFIVTVTDDLGGTTTQTITITLNNVNDAPIARPDGVHLFFDGDDFIRIADDPSLQMTNNLTMEAWINHNGGGTGSQVILNKEGEYELGITADTGEIIYAIAETTNTWNWRSTGHFVTAGEWTQVAVTFHGVAGQIHTYINGILVDTDNQPGPMGDVYTLYNDLSIGGRENATDQRFQGQIDEVRVWSTTRSQGEIQAHMNSLLTGGEAGLAGYWRLDEAGTGSILDLSGNGNDGVLGGLEGASATPAYQGYVTDEDTSLAIASVSGVLANDSDPDGDPLTVAAINGSAANIGSTVALASGALVRLNADGSLSYDPNGQFEYLTQGETVTDTFTYVASDGGSDSNSTTVTITITGVNDAPLGTDDSFTVAEGATTTLNLIANDNDVDDGLDGTSVAIVSGPAHGSLVINGDGSVDYSHDGSENFTDSFTYTIDDLFGASSNTVTVDLTITPQNDAPVNTIPGTVTVDEDTPASIAGISISDNDAAGGDLTTRLMVSNGTLDVTLAGSATISFGANGSSDLTIQGTIADINASLASLTYTGNLNLSGIAADSLVVRTGDGGNTGAGGVQQDTDTIQIDINSINDAPTISTIADQTIAEDSSTGALAFTVNDVDDAGSLTVSATSSDTALIPDANLNLVDLGGGSWTVEATPNADRSGGSVMVTVTVDDGTTTASETFAVTVNSVDDDPVAVDDAITVDAGATSTTLDSGAVSLLANDSDSDLPVDTLSVALAVGPAHGSLVLNTDGTFIYTHDGSTHFADVFTYVVRDADGGETDTGTVTVQVNPPADATPPPTTETNLPEPSHPPDQEPQPDPEPESEVPPEEILPVDDELPPREELAASTIPSPKLPMVTPLQWADPTYFVPTISMLTTDNVLPVDDGSPSAVASIVKHLQRELASETIERVASTVNALFSTESMTQTLDHIQQQLDQTLEMDGKRGQLIIGAATGLGASVFAGYVIWAFRGSSLLLGALTAMPMWRCFDPLPVLMGDDKKRRDRDEAKSTKNELDKDETTVKELLGEKQAAKDIEDLSRRND